MVRAFVAVALIVLVAPAAMPQASPEAGVAPGPGFGRLDSPLRPTPPAGAFTPGLEIARDELVFRSSSLELRVTTACRWSLHDASGPRVGSDVTNVRFLLGSAWAGPRHILGHVKGDQTVRITCTTDDPGLVVAFQFTFVGPSTLRIEAALLRDGTRVDASRSQVFLKGGTGERFYGFGEKFNAIDQTGNRVSLWIVDSAGVKGDRSYKAIPFFFSSGGWGMFANRSHRGYIETSATEGGARVSLDAPDLDLFLFGGPGAASILEQYTDVVGRLRVPPPWAFAPWKSRLWEYQNEVNIREDVDRMRQLRIPMSVLVADPVNAEYEGINFGISWSPYRFPDPDGLIRHIHDQGNKFVLWETVTLNYPNQLFPEAQLNGYFVKNEDNQTTVPPRSNCVNFPPPYPCDFIDFTNPAARAWFKELVRGLVRRGVDGFKEDFQEYFPENATTWDGRKGVELHNRWPEVLYELVYEVLDEEKPNDAVLFTRSAWATSIRHPFPWAGDQSQDWSYNNGLPSVIRAAQSSALSGFAMWGHDANGLLPPTSPETARWVTNPEQKREMFLRWTQFGALTPVLELHGVENEPWAYGEEGIRVYRKFASLHTDLFPYVFSYAHEAARAGTPIVRPLVMYPGVDADVYGDNGAEDRLNITNYEYFYGDELLVAPYFQPGSDRMVWFPPGPTHYYLFWNDARFNASSYARMRLPLDQMPLFVRAGSIIPFFGDPLMGRVDGPQTLVRGASSGLKDYDDALAELVVHVWPGASTSFRLWDGSVLSYEEGPSGWRFRTSNTEPNRTRLHIIMHDQDADADVRGAGTTTAQSSYDAATRTRAFQLEGADQFEMLSGRPPGDAPHPKGGLGLGTIALFTLVLVAAFLVFLRLRD